MTTTKWFYQINQVIKGPVTTLDLKKMISTLADSKNTFIWSRGATDWVSADRWQPHQELPEFSLESLESQPLQKNEKPHFAPLISIHDEKTNPSIENVFNIDIENIIPTAEETFRVQLNFIDQPLMTKAELMAFAARTEDPTQIAIFDNTTKEWKEIYAFKDIVEKLGLTRRKHPRVPILAQFTGSSSKHEKFSARLVTISIGGLGLTDVFDFNIGDKISGQITSPHFYSPVTIEAEATYCGNDGYVGFKFSQINDDSQSLVTDYVKRFSSHKS